MLVDNGCEGGAPEVASHDPRIKMLQEPRRGVTFARNTGILASRAEFVAFLDEDDRWMPTKLAKQVAALRAEPAAVLCHTSHEVIDADGMPIGVSDPKLAGSYEDLLGFRGGMLPSTTMVRRKALDEVGLFDHDRPTVEDYDLFLRLLKDGSAIVLPESLVEYRWHHGQSSRAYAASFKMTITILRLARHAAIRERRIDRFMLSLRGEAATRKGYGDLAFDHARQGLRDGRPATAVVSHLLFGMRTSPFGIRTFFRSRRAPQG
jgi:glycosyltransferase involved in cell wall biosynthesis